MGLFNVLGNIASAAIKTAATPLTVVSDLVEAATGNEPQHTKKTINSIGKDLEDSLDELSGDNV